MLVNVGFGNMVNKDRIIAVVSPETAPIKRLVQDSKDNGRAIDVTCGRRTRSVILTDSDHVILSAIQCDTISNRITGEPISRSEEKSDEY
jgi:regulator of extracellular matrix RemA (YlzA/DUF370 family)